MRAAAVDDQPSILGRHAGAKSVAAGADEPAGLIGAFHGISPSASKQSGQKAAVGKRLYRKAGDESQYRVTINDISAKTRPMIKIQVKPWQTILKP